MYPVFFIILLISFIVRNVILSLSHNSNLSGRFVLNTMSTVIMYFLFPVNKLINKIQNIHPFLGVII